MNTAGIIQKINDKIVCLTQQEEESIKDFLEEYEGDNTQQAQQISNMLNVSFECIFELL